MLQNEQHDDFDKDKDVKEWRRQKEEFQKMINDSIKIITDSFGAAESSHKNLKQFLLHKSVSMPFVSDSYEGNWKERSFYFSVFEYETSVHAGKVHNSGSDYYFAGVIELKKSYPHTVIVPETIGLKIENLVSKSDVDLKHSKRFSRKFHMITKDKTALELLLSNKDLNSMGNHPNAEIEINGTQCYFRESRKPICKEEAERFVALAKVLFEVF